MPSGADMRKADRRPVAVIGASAGGLEALTDLVARIEPETRIAFVIVQHLSPNEKSVLHELLQTHCPIPVTQIVEDERIEPGHVFVVPPGKVAEVDGNRLRLIDRDMSDTMFRPIDHCFESLAESHGRDGYCIVLSGTGSDGAAGLRTLKEAGGITFAQESETARFPGMPDAAVATGLVDFILPSAAIVPRLEEIVGHRRIVDDDEVRDRLRSQIEAALPRVAKVLRDALGHDFSAYKPGTMIRRIERRMSLLRTGDVERFVAMLTESEDQARNLGQEFLIGVTEFFRDPDAFAALRTEVVEPLLDRDTSSIRVWVPGCSSGEEAYSLAILFTEALEARGARRGVQIFGTDIDGQALATARAGVYPASSFTKMAEDRMERFFQAEEGGFRARTELRECCVFAPHNMVQDPPFSRLDLISCRNLMIYLSTDLQKKVLPRFHFSLKRSGFLFLGPSEGVTGDERLFETVDKHNRIFRRNDAVQASYSSLRDPVPRVGNSTPARQLGAAVAAPQPAISREVTAEREFLRRFAGPFAVVSRGGEVRYLSHAMTEFARPGQGVPTNQIDGLLAPPLRVPVRSALEAVAESGDETIIEGVFVDLGSGSPRMFDVSVAPTQQNGDEYLVVLTEVRTTDSKGIDAAVGLRESADRDILEHENIRLRRQLNATLQEYETSGQELKSTNEELMSMNEELQSSNEELETSREELQSINEELETVNAELRENNRQLIRANSDLANLFESTDLAVLFLDRSFGVRNFTPASSALFAIRQRDIGRPIFDLTSRIDYPQFREDAAAVDETLQPVDREVTIETTNETFLLRMKPYRTTDNRIDGYVLSFIDITTRKRNEEVLERQRQDLARQYAELENLYDTTPVGLSLVDRDLRWVRINERLSEINGFPIEAHIGKSLDELLPALGANLKEIYREVFRTGEPSLQNAIETDFPSAPGRSRSFLADFYPVTVDGEITAVGACVVEVTEQNRLMAELAESEARMQRLFASSPVFIAITMGPEHRYSYSNPPHDAICGHRDLIGRTILEAMPELAGQGIVERFEAVFESGEPMSVPEFKAEFDRDGDGEVEQGWFTQTLEPIRDGAGAVTGVATFAFEITEQVLARQRAEESEAQKTLLLAELQHRVKNTLATVRAVSRFLLTGSQDAKDFHARLSDRLGAMSRTHDLLTDADWVAADLADIVAAEAAPYERERDRRVHVSGDPLRLDAKEALAFGMAIHELMTNAAKYGALSTAGGRVEINVEVDDEMRHVIWREVGGPPVEDPGQKRGFGAVVIERVLASDIGADIDMRFAEDGLIFGARF